MTMIRMIAVIWALLGGAVQAQTPEDLVRWIYASRTQTAKAELTGFNYISARTLRDQFLSRRLAYLFDANDTYGDDLAAACFDFAFDIPGNDFDATEILRSLTITSTGDAEKMTVVARFTNFGKPAEVHYDFIVQRGAWRIDDVAGPGWRASQIACAPKSAPQPVGTLRAVGYCYAEGQSSLKVMVDAGGAAHFALESFQGGGHHCGAGGPLVAVEGGWDYEAVLEGGPCKIEIRVTPDQGLRLSDPDWNCKPSLCGARAVIDGLTFSRASQVACE